MPGGREEEAMTDAGGFKRVETLRNGLAVTIRSLRPDDRERIVAAFRQLDRESVYTRLFAYRSELSETELDRIMNVDPEQEVALLATIGAGTDELVIGSGRYVASSRAGDERIAEVAFVVEEDYHGLGIAGRLLGHLAAIARERGIAALEADVLADNRAMLSVFERSRLPMRQRREDGIVHLTLALKPDAA